MADDNAPEPEMTWRYNGEWRREPFPFDWPDEMSYEQALAGGGFSPADAWGVPLMNQVEIAEHHGDERWFISWSVDGNRVHHLHVIGLPNLLEVLPKISAAVTASLLSHVATRLDSLIESAGAAADRTKAAGAL